MNEINPVHHEAILGRVTGDYQWLLMKSMMNLRDYQTNHPDLYNKYWMDRTALNQAMVSGDRVTFQQLYPQVNGHPVERWTMDILFLRNRLREARVMLGRYPARPVVLNIREHRGRPFSPWDPDRTDRIW